MLTWYHLQNCFAFSPVFHAAIGVIKGTWECGWWRGGWNNRIKDSWEKSVSQGRPLKNVGGKKTLPWKIVQLIAKVVFAGDLQVSDFTVLCCLMCSEDREKWAKIFGICNLSLSSSEVSNENTEHSEQVSETCIFFLYFVFFSPNGALWLHSWTGFGPKWRRSAPSSLQRCSKACQWRVNRIQCISKGHSEMEHGVAGHKVKRKVCLEQMTCVLLMVEEKGEGEREKKRFSFICVQGQRCR